MKTNGESYIWEDAAKDESEDTYIAFSVVCLLLAVVLFAVGRGGCCRRRCDWMADATGEAVIENLAVNAIPKWRALALVPADAVNAHTAMLAWPRVTLFNGVELAQVAGGAIRASA